jgi:hypothetical protein
MALPVLGLIAKFIIANGTRAATRKYGAKAVQKAAKEIKARQKANKEKRAAAEQKKLLKMAAEKKELKKAIDAQKDFLNHKAGK